MERKPNTMFDPEVLAELRRQFDEADKDGDGQLDAGEACKMFARKCAPDASEVEVQRMADSLRQQVDQDKSGTISFDEYCFRFGRRYQMEANSRKRAAASGSNATSSNAAVPDPDASADDNDVLRREREALEREREALRREREELERSREAASRSGGDSPSGASNAPGGGDGAQRFAAGTQVTIAGLRGAPELNGRAARVCRYDDASGRYIVELVGGGGQKSLKPDNLSAAAASAASGGGSSSAFVAKAKQWVQKACANVMVWAAGYEWWQLLLGAGVVLLFAITWLQLGSRYPSSGNAGLSSGRASSYSSGTGDTGRYTSPPPPPTRFDTDDDYGGYRQRAGDQYNARSSRHRQRYGYDDGPGYGGYDSYGGYGYGGGYGGGGGGLLGSLGPTGGMLALAGIGYACWKGIIPVQRMSFFQLYMLWNIIQPLLFGGRGGSFGGPGMYRRRRYF